MADQAITPFVTVEQYFKLDERNERPSEYKNGVMVQVEASTRSHATIISNLVYLIGDTLRAKRWKCEVYTQCLRVFMPDEAVYAYPDIVLACEDSHYGPQSTLLDPLLIIEVLSPATQDYDRGTKFKHYRSMPRFSEYILVAQDRVSVEHWKREYHRWVLHLHLTDLSSILDIAGGSFPLSEIYHQVDFTKEDS